MSKENKIVIECPLFPGFYNTILSEGYFDHDSECDHYKELNLIPENIENSDIDFNFNYDQYCNDVSIAYTESVASYLADHDLASNIEFCELISPKFYNYSTDRLIISGNFNIDKILEIINNNLDKFNKFLENNFTSYDGFISFIDNNSNDFIVQLLANKEEYINVALHFAMLELYEGNNDLSYDFSIEALDSIHLSTYITKCQYKNNDEWVDVNP